ncbi:MAG: 3-dehydroquinate synthase, partial [Chloroflexota bacterium]
LSQRMHLISTAEVGRIRKIYLQAGLPVAAPNLGTGKYLQLMGLDKKVEGGKMRFILLKRIGEAVMHAEVPAALLTGTLVECIV